MDQSCQNGIDGFVATNSTVARASGTNFSREGGVSGKPLAMRSKQVLRIVRDTLGTDRARLVVSAGGVMTPDDVYERLGLGADLVQVYAALVFSGPGFFESVAKARI